VRGLIGIYFKQRFLKCHDIVIIWDVMLCVNSLDETATSIFREDNNQTARLHNLETTHAVETLYFLLTLSDPLSVVYFKPFGTEIWHLNFSTFCM
jgi:hypothetical protein